MKCYSALKRKELTIHATKDMNPEDIVLSDISQSGRMNIVWSTHEVPRMRYKSKGWWSLFSAFILHLLSHPHYCPLASNCPSATLDKKNINNVKEPGSGDSVVFLCWCLQPGLLVAPWPSTSFSEGLWSHANDWDFEEGNQRENSICFYFFLAVLKLFKQICVLCHSQLKFHVSHIYS